MNGFKGLMQVRGYGDPWIGIQPGLRDVQQNGRLGKTKF